MLNLVRFLMELRKNFSKHPSCLLTGTLRFEAHMNKKEKVDNLIKLYLLIKKNKMEEAETLIKKILIAHDIFILED